MAVPREAIDSALRNVPMPTVSSEDIDAVVKQMVNSRQGHYSAFVDARLVREVLALLWVQGHVIAPHRKEQE